MNEFSGVCFLVVAALSGWFFLQALARLLPQNLVLMFAWIGQRTMPIMLFHFLAFKIVSAIGILIKGEDWVQLGAFPFCFSGWMWCLAYTIAGVLLPAMADVRYGRLMAWARSRLA